MLHCFSVRFLSGQFCVLFRCLYVYYICEKLLSVNTSIQLSQCLFVSVCVLLVHSFYSHCRAEWVEPFSWPPAATLFAHCYLFRHAKMCSGNGFRNMTDAVLYFTPFYAVTTVTYGDKIGDGGGKRRWRVWEVGKICGIVVQRHMECNTHTRIGLANTKSMNI